MNGGEGRKGGRGGGRKGEWERTGREIGNMYRCMSDGVVFFLRTEVGFLARAHHWDGGKKGEKVA
jgi:hypothetical protein